MIKMPLNDIIFKIKEKTGLSEEDINKKIDDKLTQLSGLISRQGAAHIIANECGVKLFEATTGKLQIKNILSGMRSVETVGKVQQIFEVREFNTGTRSGKVGSAVVGDETGTIRLVFWNDQADTLTKLKENDIVKLVGGYVRENQGKKEIHLNDRSKIVINPEGETIGEVKQFTTERKKITDLQENDQNIEILGTIVQAFEPRFFEVCPQCGKRARQHQDSFMCEEHKKVTPDYSYVINAVIDDGSMPDGTIRIVCFKNQAERLLSKTPEQMLKYKDNPTDFENAKNEIMGKIMKLVGRVSKNTMFDRLEFNTQLVFTDPNPEEEIKKLKEETS
ncbi:OB-fold nucleic acid binding domain-containing protein [Nanoarchaeota archaeon]